MRARARRRRPRRRSPRAAPRWRRAADRRVLGDAAAPDARTCSPGGRPAARAAQPRRRAPRRLLAAGHEQQDFGARGALALGQGGDRAARDARAPRSATARTRARQPSSVGAWGRARATIMLAPSATSSESSRARASSSSRSVSSRASSARRKSAAAVSAARSGARTRSTSEAIIVTSSRRIEALGSVRARMCSEPTTASATRSGSAHAVAAREQRALLGGRARGDREGRAPRVGHREARVERLRRRAHDLRQSGAGLDRLGDRVQGGELSHGAQPQK